MLSRMDGYRAAVVGWNPEDLADPAELRAGWSDELAQGDLPGLVLSGEVHRTLHPTTGFEPFDNDHEWLPYRGERTGNHG
ncbi:hypothetical protein [Saccharothrix sp. NRRL B-16348]|uniref:hypothetical protein n=1 Tax=Saccharothrix sp. NRRL B-16348 TaxID=1415542 RepID=UPI0012F9018B|nr:hypothetical protein [Saccharothrix sp. NRRL B-16348]